MELWLIFLLLIGDHGCVELCLKLCKIYRSFDLFFGCSPICEYGELCEALGLSLSRRFRAEVLPQSMCPYHTAISSSCPQETILVGPSPWRTKHSDHLCHLVNLDLLGFLPFLFCMLSRYLMDFLMAFLCLLLGLLWLLYEFRDWVGLIIYKREVCELNLG